MAPSSSPTRKKRKKSKELSTSAKKDSKKADSLKNVTIKVKKPSAAEDPVLVSFPGGAPLNPPQFEWRKLHAKYLAGRLVQGKDKDGTCVYRATSQGIGYDDRRTKLCIGVYDKEKGVVTIQQVASRGTVYALQQHLQSYQETIAAEVATNSMELFADFGSAKKRKVLKSQQANRVNVDTVVGSGKAMIDSVMENGAQKMSESNRKAIEQALVKAEDGSAPPTAMSPAMVAVEAAHEQARRSFLPPYNPRAESVCNVYDFRGVLGDSGWDTVRRTVDACLFKEDEGFVEAITRGKPDKDGNIPPPEKRDWSATVLDCLRNVESKGVVEIALQESNKEAEKRNSAKHQLRCVLVLHFLVRFYRKFNGGQGRRGRIVFGLEDDQPKWFGIPRGAALALLQSFATERDVQKSIVPREDDKEKNKNRYEPNPDVPRYVMSPANKDRCLVHILLLYLLARGGPKSMSVNDMTLILEDLDVDTKHAGGLLRMAGCTVATSAQIKRTKAFLAVPLTFPQPKRRGGKR